MWWARLLQLMLLLVMGIKLLLLLFRMLLGMLSMMVMRLMGHQNQYDHDDIISNVMNSCRSKLIPMTSGTSTYSNRAHHIIINRWLHACSGT